MQHVKGKATQIIGWKSTLAIIAAIISVAIFLPPFKEGVDKNQKEQRQEEQEEQEQEKKKPKLVTTLILDNGVKMQYVTLLPGQWSEKITTPTGSKWSFLWDTVTGELRTRFQDGTILDQKTGGEDRHFKLPKRGVFKFYSEKGGKVTVASEGGIDFFSFK